MTVNLAGSLQGPVKHTTRVKNIVKGKEHTYSKVILHTDRKYNECTRVTHISEEIVQEWIGRTCPDWERPGVWKKLSSLQKVNSYVKTFDEGFGTSFTVSN
jgi:hypothetical protein